MKRMIWDIETSPNIGLFWQPGNKVMLSYDNIIKERAIICICWKWEDENKVHHLTWDNGDDRAMCEEFLDIAITADELIAHNGDKYDLPFFNARCVIHGLDPSPILKTVDTLAIARKRFKFNSNRLDYLGDVLIGERKIHAEYELWKDILLDNCPKAMNKMVRYCKQDVRLLEKVWKKIAPYHAPKTHAGVMNYREKWTCPWTGSENVVISKRRVTAAGTKQWQMKSNETGGYYTINEKTYNEYREWREEQKK